MVQHRPIKAHRRTAPALSSVRCGCQRWAFDMLRDFSSLHVNVQLALAPTKFLPKHHFAGCCCAILATVHQFIMDSYYQSRLSVLALASEAAQINKAISRLRHFVEVPGRVNALKNEVSDLEGVLRQVGHVLEQKSLSPDNEHGSLEQILAQAKGHLADLAKALERVAIACAGGKVMIISKSTIWWKENTLFQCFQEDMGSDKATLNLMLGAANS